MPWNELSVDSIKAYPWWLVATCGGVVLAVATLAVAKSLKWLLYLALSGGFVLAMVTLVTWLRA